MADEQEEDKPFLVSIGPVVESTVRPRWVQRENEHKQQALARAAHGDGEATTHERWARRW